MSTHHCYGPNGEYLGSSVHKGDRIENFDELGRQVSTSWVYEDRVDTYGVGEGLTQREWKISDRETDVRDAAGEYLGSSWDAGTHTDYYDADGGYAGSDW